MKSLLGALSLAGCAAAAVLATGGCTTESFCFADCAGQNIRNGQSGGGPLDGSAGVITIPDSGGGLHFGSGGQGGGGGCQAEEIPCNGVDDNCNGKTDEGTDYTQLTQCGNCATNCNLSAPANEEAVGCTPPATDLGTAAGTCKFQCAQDFFDLDPNQPGCETYCLKTSDKDDPGVCGLDDNCDGKVDEGIDLCKDPKNCGECGRTCVLANATTKCVQRANTQSCNKDTTDCLVDKCADGWWDADGRSDNGCEYSCTQTNGGVEICDGVDNDCDNLIDNEDDSLTGIEAACFGGTLGECAADTHKGKNKCISGAVICCDVSSDTVTSTSTNTKQPKTGPRNGICDGPTAPHVLHPTENPELCNNLDDNCDGQIDETPTDVGQVRGNSRGQCSPGVMQCDLTLHKPVLVGATGPATDSTGAPVDACDGTDNDCDGVANGTVVASNTSPPSCLDDLDCTSIAGSICLAAPGGTVCKKPLACTTNADCSSLTGTICMQGANGKVCAIPSPGVGDPCDVPTKAPCVNASGAVVDCSTTGATPVPQPCKAGVSTCVGAPVCSGSIKPAAGAKDKCGEDTNCDGSLDNQPNVQTDVHNCGTCGNDCFAKGAHANWTCVAGVCTLGTPKCIPGYINCDSNPNDCERQCTPSGAEVCNGFDDNCDCNIDEGNIPKPTAVQVCGVDQAASDPKCTTQVGIACTNGAWKCTFPAGICTTGTCSTSPDPCDGIDNNCNSVADESFKQPFKATKYLTQPCFSDDGKPPPGDGACRGSGTYVCKADGTDTVCSATFQSGNKQPEACDGVDNDCDGVVDEAYNNSTGAADGIYVKPDVVNIGTNKWIFKYEASRPNAGTTTPGSGNGYFTSAPAGTTLDKTVACSVQNKIPWFNLTPQEAAQTCTNRGGQLCTLADWQTACRTTAGTPCTWGYTTACTTAANYANVNGPFCNLGGFDFDTSTAFNDDGLLVTGSTRLKQCSASWSTNGVFDITGNLREITVNGGAYALMGGAYNTSTDSGAQCDFTFYSVDQNFKFFDTGFRCCFSTNPSP